MFYEENKIDLKKKHIYFFWNGSYGFRVFMTQTEENNIEELNFK